MRLLALVAIAVLAAPVVPQLSLAEGFDVQRPSVSRKRRARTAPVLPSERAPEVVEVEEGSWDEYNRERAEYYRERREREERAARPAHGGGACMYGADGRLLFAPAGRSCPPSQ